MKVVSLCGTCCGECPEVKVTDEYVEVGEEGNLCILKKSEWELLREKILSGEL